jgi:hypothetical protein
VEFRFAIEAHWLTAECRTEGMALPLSARPQLSDDAETIGVGMAGIRQRIHQLARTLNADSGRSEQE